MTFRLSNSLQPPTQIPRSISPIHTPEPPATTTTPPFTSSPRQQFQGRSQPHRSPQPDGRAARSGPKRRLWRQYQRPAPSALATVLTGTRSGYFFLIFSPSERRFSNGCSSLYTNFILPGTGLDRTGLREPREGGPGTGGGGSDGGDAQADSAERSQDLRDFPIRQPRPRPSGAACGLRYATSAAAPTRIA